MTSGLDRFPEAERLAGLNRELAELLRMPPLELAFGSEAAAQDELVLCGLVGGKDVGKSTLINALAKTCVAPVGEKPGRGTQRPTVFIHESARGLLERRLGHFAGQAEVEVSSHRSEGVRNVVLLDLPDFDSEFQAHAQIVRRVLPFLDRVVWVVTPRKIGDRAWAALTAEVLKDSNNVYFVLNKVDELLADFLSPPSRQGRPAGEDGRSGESFWFSQREWVAGVLEGLGHAHDGDRCFLVAAGFPDPDHFVGRVGGLWDDAHWTHHAQDRKAVVEIARLAAAELTRLRQCVLGPVAREQATALKAANRAFERGAAIERIRTHYRLDELVAQLTAVCDPSYQQQILNQAFGEVYCAQAAAALRRRMRPAAELADQLLQERVEQWPLLPLVYWPFGWLSRLLGRRLMFSPNEPTQAAFDPWEGDGLPLRQRIEGLRSRLLADHAGLVDQLRLEPDLASAKDLTTRVEGAAAALVPQFETRCRKGIADSDRRPRLLSKASLWLILLWFPLGQPVLEVALNSFSLPLRESAVRVAARLVAALSATHLLSSLAVVTAIFVVILAGMYRRRLRAVRKVLRETEDPLGAGSPSLSDDVDDLLVSHAVTPLMAPFQNRLRRLSAIGDELSPNRFLDGRPIDA